LHQRFLDETGVTECQLEAITVVSVSSFSADKQRWHTCIFQRNVVAVIEECIDKFSDFKAID
jgi:hypothetical protein